MVLEEKYRIIIWPTEILVLPKLSQILFLKQSLIFILRFERPFKTRITHCWDVNTKYFFYFFIAYQQRSSLDCWMLVDEAFVFSVSSTDYSKIIYTSGCVA